MPARAASPSRASASSPLPPSPPQEVIEPAYKMLMFYLRHLCYAYDRLEGKSKDVPGLKEIFGSSSGQLPGKVLPPPLIGECSKA